MITEAIILAGGKGERMVSVTKNEIPKAMIEIANKPFLEHLLSFLVKQDIKKVIFSVGHLASKIMDYFGFTYKTLKIEYTIEPEPLGCGGGIKKALKMIRDDDCFVFYGDSLFDINIQKLAEFHQKKKAIVTIALKQTEDVSRYGVISIKRGSGLIMEITDGVGKGYINGGSCVLNREGNNVLFHKNRIFDRFHFIKDYIKPLCCLKKFYGLPFKNNHIDIGIPEDFERAKSKIL
ncbi:MAG: sugar phosphate nucleotidyltransferase [Planctomycetota bacterium]|nr:sugar phosphate nucleotidyltransferase [Planctomycetota bacterium]